VRATRIRIAKFKATLLSIAALLVIAPVAGAQEAGEPLFEELTRSFKKKSLSIGALFQAVADFRDERSFPGQNGFSIANMRLMVYGELDSGFGYLFAANFVNSPAILDAKMYYALFPGLVVDGGLFKAPFSREFLTFAGSIDFVNRSRVVSALAPGRQLGVNIRGATGEGTLAYGVGVFNGNAFDGNTNDSDEFLWVARLAFLPPSMRDPSGSDQLELAVNVAYSEDENVSLGGDLLDGFSGQRALIGADARLTRGDLLLAGEFIVAELDVDAGERFEPLGWHLTAGYMVTPKSQLLVRWDRFDSDDLQSDPDLIILGYNLWPTSPTELQVNYVIPTRGGADNHQLLVNAQVAF